MAACNSHVFAATRRRNNRTQSSATNHGEANKLPSHTARFKVSRGSDTAISARVWDAAAGEEPMEAWMRQRQGSGIDRATRIGLGQCNSYERHKSIPAGRSNVLIGSHR
jgi:hypothetical protein